MSSAPGIAWLGPVFDPTGYADEGRGILGALDRAKVPVALRPMERRSVGFREGLPDAERAMLDRLIAQPLPQSYALVQHVTADGFQRLNSARYMVGRTMFETDSIPPTWVSPSNMMDELWLPSTFNAESFRRAGVTVPIHLVPGGIDSSVYRPDIAPLPLAGLHGTVFLSVFEWRLRKGWDVLLRAWAAAFTPADDVTLVIRTYPIDRADGRDNRTIIDEQIADYLRDACGGRTRADVARIVVLPDKIAARDMPALYRIAHAYVSPTRGEGWGRPFMEAMASGVPVIATRWSAHLEFLHDENGYLLDVESVGPADDIEVPLYAGQHWANPSAAHLTSLLQRVHNDRAEAAAIGARARADMVRDWPWSRAADAIRARLRDIGTHRAFSPSPQLTDHTARQLRVRARLFDGHAWTYASEQLASAIADYHGATCSMHNATTEAQRPSWSDRTRAAWDAIQPPPRDTTSQDITLTFLDRGYVADTTPPASGAWVVYTADVVADTVPGEYVRLLRDQATEVWTPTSEVMHACLRVGVDRARLWQVPGVAPLDRCPIDGVAMPLTGINGDVVLFPIFDARQGEDLSCLLNAWPTSVLATRQATLLVLYPDAATATNPRHRDELLALLARGGVEHGIPVRVDGRALTLETIAAFVRAATMVITSPTTTTRTDVVHHLACQFNRAVVQLDPSRSIAHTQQLLDAAHTPAPRADHTSADDMRRQVHERLSALFAFHTPDAPRTLSTSGITAAPIASARTTRCVAFPDWRSGKGAGIARSYFETFSAHDDVVLVLAHDPAQGMPYEQVRGMLDDAALLAGRTTTERPEVVVMQGPLTESARAALLCACDVAVGVDDPPLTDGAQRLARPVVQALVPSAWRQCYAAAIRRAERRLTTDAPPTSS